MTCQGHFAGQLPLPRGIGLDVAGIVDAIGEGVTDVAIGDSVLGAADFMNGSSAGASDRAIMYYWFRMPAGLDFVQAAALPMAVETAYRGIDTLGVKSGLIVLVHGAGTTVGFAAVQIALMRGARVIATAGPTYADKLRSMGALVTSYGVGMVERVTELAKRPVDLALDTAPISGSLKDLVQIVNGHPQHVLTVSDFAAPLNLAFAPAMENCIPHVMTLSATLLGTRGRQVHDSGREDFRTRRLAFSCRNQPERECPRQTDPPARLRLMSTCNR